METVKEVSEKIDKKLKKIILRGKHIDKGMRVI